MPSDRPPLCLQPTVRAIYTSPNSMFSGIGIRCSLFTATYYAYPPPGRMVMTLPYLVPSSARRQPAHSSPKIFVAPLGAGYLPYLCKVSALFTEVALISTRHCPSFGVGIGDSPNVITEGGPNSLSATCFINLPTCYIIKMKECLNYVVSVLLNKSEHCGHGGCCGEHLIVQSYQTLKYTYCIKTALSLIGLLLAAVKQKKLPELRAALAAFMSSDTLRYCGFSTVYTILVKFIHCFLRQQSSRDNPKHAFYSGFIAAVFAMFFLRKQNRKLWALYMLVRGLDSYFSELHHMKYSWVAIFAIMNVVTGYAYFYEEDCFGADQMKTWKQFQNFSPRELHLRDLTNLSKFAR